MKRALVLGGLLSCMACDSSYGGFLGAIPVEDDNEGEVVDVYLAIDGVSLSAFDEARARGAFARFRATPMVAFYPAISDYSWTRLLRATPMESYEHQYYDPAARELHGEGIAGVIDHPLKGGLLDPLPAYRRFDFLGNGELWTARGYADPEAALPGTLDELFTLLASRGRQQDALLAYLMNVDVVSHRGGKASAIAMLVEISRRIEDFKARHPGRFRFTLFSDHGNAHERAALVDPHDILEESGVRSVSALGDDPAVDEAVAIVHVRVNSVSLHTHPSRRSELARRLSRHRHVDLALTSAGDPGAPTRFELWRGGESFAFEVVPGGFAVENARAWNALGIDFAGYVDPATGAATLSDRDALTLTAAGPYPDLFHRVATAFTHPAARIKADVFLSLPDDVTSFGFHVPGSGDSLAVDGFHGALTRGSSISVVATDGPGDLPPVVRADDIVGLFPPLARKLASAAE